MAYQDAHDDVECDDNTPNLPRSTTSDGVSRALLESFVPPLCEEEIQAIIRIDVERSIRHFEGLYRTLIALADFKPSPLINRLFIDLVSSCLQPYHELIARSVLEDARIRKIGPRLREICSEGETELERYWAVKIGEEAETAAIALEFVQAFAEFPYYSNYDHITNIEVSLIRAALPPNSVVRNLAFIGSGPLPLTSFLLAQTHFTSANITNIDCDLHALKISNKLASGLGLDGRIHTLHAKADKISTTVLGWCDVVYLAALVGMSSSAKCRILGSVTSKMKEGAILLARSAYGLRSLLYPVLDVEALNLRRLRLELVTEWNPEDNEVVNSVVVFRKISAAG